MAKNIKKSGTHVDRRRFLKGVAATGAVGAVAAVHPASARQSAGQSATTTKSWRDKPDPIDESLISDGGTYDVVVVGGSNAGSICASAASQKGASVAVIENRAEKSYTRGGGKEIGIIIKNVKIDFVGDGRSDFVAAGTAVVAAGKDTKLILDNVTINTQGVVRSGVIAKEHSNVIVKNSKIDVKNGVLPPDYESTMNISQMRSTFWISGMTGTTRATSILGGGIISGSKNFVLTFNNASITGVITSSDALHYYNGKYYPKIGKPDFKAFGAVVNAPNPAVNNGVIATLTNGSKWIDTGTSYLTKLVTEEGSTVTAPSGRTLSMKVGDGNPATSIPAGTYAGNIVITVN